MSLPPIGRRAFVADAAGGLLLCTLAGKQFDAHKPADIEKLASEVPVPPKVAAAKQNAAVAPGQTVLAKAANSGPRVLDPGREREVEHRPERAATR